MARERWVWGGGTMARERWVRGEPDVVPLIPEQHTWSYGPPGPTLMPPPIPTSNLAAGGGGSHPHYQLIKFARVDSFGRGMPGPVVLSLLERSRYIYLTITACIVGGGSPSIPHHHPLPHPNNPTTHNVRS